MQLGHRVVLKVDGILTSGIVEKVEHDYIVVLCQGKSIVKNYWEVRTAKGTIYEDKTD